MCEVISVESLTIILRYIGDTNKLNNEGVGGTFYHQIMCHYTPSHHPGSDVARLFAKHSSKSLPGDQILKISQNVFKNILK